MTMAQGECDLEDGKSPDRNMGETERQNPAKAQAVSKTSREIKRCWRYCDVISRWPHVWIVNKGRKPPRTQRRRVRPLVPNQLHLFLSLKPSLLSSLSSFFHRRSKSSCMAKNPFRAAGRPPRFTFLGTPKDPFSILLSLCRRTKEMAWHLERKREGDRAPNLNHCL